MLVGAVAAACQVATDLDQIVAIEVSLPDSGRVAVGATLRPTARALNGRGDSVAADIVWASLDTAIVAVLDSTTGETLGLAAGNGRLQARVGPLRTNPLTVVVFTPPAAGAPTYPSAPRSGTFTILQTFAVESRHE